MTISASSYICSFLTRTQSIGLGPAVVTSLKLLSVKTIFKYYYILSWEGYMKRGLIIQPITWGLVPLGKGGDREWGKGYWNGTQQL